MARVAVAGRPRQGRQDEAALPLALPLAGLFLHANLLTGIVPTTFAGTGDQGREVAGIGPLRGLVR